MKQPSKNANALQPKAKFKRRWARNGELCEYWGISKMTLWRFKQDPNFPPAAVINKMEFNDLDKADEWMEAHIGSGS
jgi:hypothetical protein